MANPTTNYGFVLPTSTDLVTDLPADFDVALQGVDTRLKALNPETTLGDIAYRSSTANTNTRLGIGTTGQILTVSGGVPVWAAAPAGASMTSIASGSLTGASVSLTSISGSYRDLILRLSNYSSNGDSFGVSYRYNNVSTSSYRGTGATDSNALAFNATEIDGSNPQDTSAGNGFIELQIFDYAGSTWKVARNLAITNNDTTPTTFNIQNFTVLSNITAAITRIDIFSDGADFDGGTYVLYGVN